MRNTIAWAALALSVPTTHAAERVFEPVALPGQELKYIDGTPHLVARGQTGGVILAFDPEGKKRAWVTVFAANTGTSPVNLKETDITAVDGKGQPLHVYSYAELQKQHSRSEMWGAVAAGFAGAGRSMSAANAGSTRQYGSYNGTTQAEAWGSGGYARGTATTSGTYSGYGYNGAAAYQAQQHANAQNAADAARMRETNALNRSSLASRALKANTIDPGATLIGQVSMDLPKVKRGEIASFDVTVPLGAEIFTVRFVESTE